MQYRTKSGSAFSPARQPARTKGAQYQAEDAGFRYKCERNPVRNKGGGGASTITTVGVDVDKIGDARPPFPDGGVEGRQELKPIIDCAHLRKTDDARVDTHELPADNFI